MLHAFPTACTLSPCVPYRRRALNCQLSTPRFGRVAFACPGEQLQRLEADVRAAGHTVHTPYVSLDTPGKATVQVVILQDPDGHEVRGGRWSWQLNRGGVKYSVVGLACRSAGVVVGCVRIVRMEGVLGFGGLRLRFALALACERVLASLHH